MMSDASRAGWIVIGFSLLLAAVVALETGNTRDQEDPRLTQVAAAIHTGDKLTLVKVLEKDPAFVHVLARGESWLHMAARADRPEMIELLLAKGADLNGRGEWDETALHWACYFGSDRAAETLAEKGLNIEDTSNRFSSTPLLWAAQGSVRVANQDGDYVATVRMLIDRGAAINACNQEGVPAVVLASEEVANELQKHGAHVPMPEPAGGHLAM